MSTDSPAPIDLELYRVRDAHTKRKLGTVFANSSVEAMKLARAKWPDKYPYLNVELV